MRTAKQPIKLAALNTIQRNGETILPGVVFSVEDSEEAQRLIECGAAVPVEAEGRTPLNVSENELTKYLTDNHEVGHFVIAPNGKITTRYFSPDGSGPAMSISFNPPNFRTENGKQSWIKNMTEELKRKIFAVGASRGFHVQYKIIGSGV